MEILLGIFYLFLGLYLLVTISGLAFPIYVCFEEKDLIGFHKFLKDAIAIYEDFNYYELLVGTLLIPFFTFGVILYYPILGLYLFLKNPLNNLHKFMLGNPKDLFKFKIKIERR